MSRSALLVEPGEAGAVQAIHVAHQLGGALGLGLLGLVCSHAPAIRTQDRAALAQRMAAVVDVGALLLGLAFIVPWGFIDVPGRFVPPQPQEAHP